MKNDDFSLSLVAKLYYLDKIKQKDIAKMFKTSPMVISRMVKDAEDCGLVQIVVKTPDKIDFELSTNIKRKFNLKECFVIENIADEKGSDTVARFLAKYVLEITPKNGVIGVSWGNTIRKFAENLDYVNRNDVTVVELTGGFYSKNGEMNTPTGIIIKICEKIRSEHMILNAPYYVQSIAAKNELKEDENNRELIKLANKANVNIISASAFNRSSTTYNHGVINEEDYQELERKNAIGDLAGVFFDKNGKEIIWGKRDLFMGVPLSIINKADFSICMAAGKEKSEIIKTLSCFGYFNVLVIDKELANSIVL